MISKPLMAVALAALVLSACSRTPDGPLKYAVDIDAKSTQKEKFQFSAFYPGDITAWPGDSIKFRNRSTEAPHTVTFGVNADRSNQPPILTGKGENPAVLEGCQLKELPTDELTKCSSNKLRAYDGSGYWNSGFLQAKPVPKEAGPKNVTLKLADDIPAGNYTFICILHPFMSGNLAVVDEGDDRSHPAEVRKEANQVVASAQKAAGELEEPKLEGNEDGVVAAAGWGDRTVSVNRFGPATIEVDPGTSVTWEARNPYEPHTVTFESPFASPGDPAAFRPGGITSGSEYSGGFAHSGLFGAKGTPFAGSFSLTFTTPGTYKYTCVLHPGMDGAVTVG